MSTLRDAVDYAKIMGQHVTLLLGVVAEHDSEVAESILDDMLAHIMIMRDMPLTVHAIKDDCLLEPPERNNVHVEVRWISI